MRSKAPFQVTLEGAIFMSYIYPIYAQKSLARPARVFQSVANPLLFAKLYGMLPDIYEQNAEKVRELLKPLGWTLRVRNRRDKKFAYAHRRLSREVNEEKYLAPLDDKTLTRIAALAESSKPKLRTDLKTGLCYERLNRTKSLVVCGPLSSAGK